MSQRALEAALGRLVCDSGFRLEFSRNPEEATARAGLDLTPVELGSLHKIDLNAIEAFAAHVDDRVQLAVELWPTPRGRSPIAP